ncbi:hypothetical protein K432DRAFT_377436 [Lepidopterella palustris CBS 459.81]|uniref:DUF1275 domain protein n=1 Tax=Lepidopterella palustris CBS 459.81 TaxID=1314670 RepID=A0A8E2JKC9_9PEZI|nr:hypothetical protein K432DRAFT_377436 [Lepidopterella palustris CBS 459.81]
MKLFSKRYLTETVNPTRGDIPLLICCFTTGLLDSAAFNNWGVFVGMQTGNTVLLALSTAGLPVTQHHATATTLTSLGSFLIGAYLTFYLSRRTNPLSRIFITLSFLAQAFLVALAASLTTAGLVPEDRDGGGAELGNIRILTALPPLAFHFGMQIATSRILGFNEIPANVLTSSYADLMGDPKLFSLQWNPKRDRRVGSVVLILGGAISGAWMMKKGLDIYGQMWIGAGLKLLTAMGILLFMDGKTDVGLITGSSAGMQMKETRV